MTNESIITEAKGSIFKIKKYIDDLELLDSGVIHCLKNSVIKIKINDFDLNFILVKDTEEKRRIRLKEQSSNFLTLEFVNFDESLGAGVFEPTSILVINGKEIFFTFFIRSLDERQKEFTYSLLFKNK
ncbi:DUF6864 domain-containing function [uncultured Acinetobacter sp.]|uniref:DUF6864 domain-containing function n=1 Tax=uncultured Acinetobacter sp. TaxID=165433 RepID=UPI002586565B|nr:hypothetical protein [uncultured Acinetobacter sp.]